MSYNIKNLSLKLDSQLIFNHVNFELVRGMFHTVIGPSGAGKTQLLRTLADLNSNTLKSPLNEKTSFVFQNSNLIPWLTAHQNVEITSSLNEIEIKTLFQEFNMAEYSDYKPFQLSGGMQQRVSLIRALANPSPIMLFDEPFSNLDLVNKRKNQDFLLNFWRKNKSTILYVTHDVDEAIMLSEKVMFFSKSKKTITDNFEINEAYPRSSNLFYLSKTMRDLREKIIELYESDIKDENQL